MIDTAADPLAALRVRTRRFLYLLVISAAACQGLAAILSATVLYSPAHWPDARPPSTPLFSANDRSRWCTVWSLAERGTFQIDDIMAVPGWDTIDKVRRDGHFYSSKPALMPTVTAGLYWGLKRATGLDLLKDTHTTVRVLLILVNLVPLVVAWGLIAAIGEHYARTDWSRFCLILTAAFGTFLTTFLVTLNNHSWAATSMVFAIYPALRICIDGERRPLQFALAGFWAAFAVCNELPACVFGAGMFFVLMRYAPAATLKFFVPGALIPLGAFFATTLMSTGSWLPFYSAFGTEAYRYVVEGVPSYWMNPSGLDRSTESWGTYLLHCTFGHHGIFSLSPIFVLSLLSWIGFPRRLRDTPLRGFCCATLAMTIWTLAFYLKQTANYNYGGNSSGLRWAFWLIPFWLVSMIPVLDEWGGKRWFQLLTALLLGVSVFSASFPHNNPWQPPWLQTVMESWDWVDYGTPVHPFAQKRQSWIGPLPERNAKSPSWIEFTDPSALGGTVRMRLESIDDVRQDGGNLRHLRATTVNSIAGASASAVLDCYIDEARFKAAAVPAEFVKRDPNSPAGTSLKEAILFLQGLPTPREYFPGSTRYLKTPLQKDAFRCQLAASSVLYRPARDADPLVYRRVLWLSGEVPFGVLQYEDTVIDPRDNSILFKQRFTASAVSGMSEKK